MIDAEYDTQTEVSATKVVRLKRDIWVVGLRPAALHVGRKTVAKNRCYCK